MERMPQFKTEDSGFLRTREAKKNVFEASFSLANYLKEEKINNVIFLDNGARQAHVGLQEAWKEVADGKRTPNIYFINPREILDSINLSDYSFDARDSQYLKNKFFNTFKHLDLNETVLLYDACIHSGSSVFSTKSFLEHLGFKNVKTAVTSVSDDFSKESLGKIDLVCLDSDAALGCYPFGRPTYVTENPGELVSKTNSNSDARERGQKEHDKIRGLFKKNENNQV